MKVPLFILIVLLFITMTKTNAKPIPEDKLPKCPSSPNCVSSQAKDKSHYIAPFKLKVEPEVAWDALQQALLSLPRTKIIKKSERRMDAECRSLIFGFVDDVNAILDSENKTIQIRSASRLGYSDLGVNRRRVEQLRQILIDRQIID